MSSKERFKDHALVSLTTKNRTNARYLVGFFSFGIQDNPKSSTIQIRDQHRQHLAMAADPRICPLSWFLDDEGAPNTTILIPKNDTSQCQFIYTFVAGFDNSSLPTELLPSDDEENVTSVVNRDVYYKHIQSHPQDSDITILNIQENMNEGKSQTWFKYASQIMEQYDFDYAIKADTDSYILTDLFFDFANQYLPIRGHRIYAGTFWDKAFWDGSRYGKNGRETVNYMRNRYLIQVYMGGPFYVLSKDLAKWVSSKTFVNESWYEKIEDHDIGMRVSDFPEPTQMIWIHPAQIFWLHPAKTRLMWEVFMNRMSLLHNGTSIFPEANEARLERSERETFKLFDRFQR